MKTYLKDLTPEEIIKRLKNGKNYVNGRKHLFKIDCHRVVGFGFYDLEKYTIYKSGRISVNINKNRELELANNRTPAQMKAIIENLL